SSTTPHPSWPSTVGNAIGVRPSSTERSVWQIPLALMRTVTSLGPSGSASTSSTTSLPTSYATAALMTTSNSSGHAEPHAPVDDNHLRGGEPWRRQHHAVVGDLGRLTGTAEHGARLHRLPDLRHVDVPHGSLHRPDRDRVDPDVVLAQRIGEQHRQVVHTCLGHAVGDAAAAAGGI